MLIIQKPTPLPKARRHNFFLGPGRGHIEQGAFAGFCVSPDGVIDLMVVSDPLQKDGHPLVQVDHFDPPKNLLGAEFAEIVPDIGGQVSGEGGEQDAVVFVGEDMLRQPFGPVDGRHRFARAGS